VEETEMNCKNLIAALAAFALVVALAPAAGAVGLAPRNNVTYACSSSGSLDAIVFHLSGSPGLLRGTCDFKDSGVWDTKKCDLVWQNNSTQWEFTQVGEGQCKNTIVFRDYPLDYVLFRSCTGSLTNATCWAPLY
jgi:hypothetical protein